MNTVKSIFEVIASITVIAIMVSVSGVNFIM